MMLQLPQDLEERKLYLVRLGLNYDKEPKYLTNRLFYCWHHLYTPADVKLLFCELCHMSPDGLLSQEVKPCSCLSLSNDNIEKLPLFPVVLSGSETWTHKSRSTSLSCLPKGWVPHFFSPASTSASKVARLPDRIMSKPTIGSEHQVDTNNNNFGGGPATEWEDTPWKIGIAMKEDRYSTMTSKEFTLP